MCIYLFLVTAWEQRRQEPRIRRGPLYSNHFAEVVQSEGQLGKGGLGWGWGTNIRRDQMSTAITYTRTTLTIIIRDGDLDRDMGEGGFDLYYTTRGKTEKA